MSAVAPHALPPTTLRVERKTVPAVNEAIREATDRRVARYEVATLPAFAARLAQLDREWDIERVLQANAGSIALAGTLAGLVDRRWLLLPTAVFSFLLLHALHGWCPPVPVFRRLGVRTAREIARERHALKALRGDYDGLPPAGVPMTHRVRAALDAVDR